MHSVALSLRLLECVEQWLESGAPLLACGVLLRETFTLLVRCAMRASRTAHPEVSS